MEGQVIINDLTINSYNLEQIKKQILIHLIVVKNLSVSETVKLTGMSESTLYRTLYNFNIKRI